MKRLYIQYKRDNFKLQVLYQKAKNALWRYTAETGEKAELYLLIGDKAEPGSKFIKLVTANVDIDNIYYWLEGEYVHFEYNKSVLLNLGLEKWKN